MAWLTTAPTRSAWQTVLEHATIADKSWADLLATRVDQLAELATIVTPTSDVRQSVLHTDLQPKNVLVTSTGFALPDWDDAARCSRDRILARALIEWLTPGGIRADLIPVFMHAYWSQGGRGVIDDVKAFGYAAAAFLNHLFEMVDSDSRADRGSDDSSRAIVTALTRPLDISTLEAVLEMVRLQ